MNEISRKPAHTVTELASARQHQENPADHHGARVVVEASTTSRGGCNQPPPHHHRNEKRARCPAPRNPTGNSAGSLSCLCRHGSPLEVLVTGFGRANSAIFKVRDFACFCGSKYVPSM